MEAEIGQQLGSTRRLAFTPLCSAQPPTTALQASPRLLLMKMLSVIVIVCLGPASNRRLKNLEREEGLGN